MIVASGCRLWGLSAFCTTLHRRHRYYLFRFPFINFRFCLFDDQVLRRIGFDFGSYLVGKSGSKSSSTSESTSKIFILAELTEEAPSSSLRSLFQLHQQVYCEDFNLSIQFVGSPCHLWSLTLPHSTRCPVRELPYKINKYKNSKITVCSQYPIYVLSCLI